jgi:hypothetical protein
VFIDNEQPPIYALEVRGSSFARRGSCVRRHTRDSRRDQSADCKSQALTQMHRKIVHRLNEIWHPRSWLGRGKPVLSCGAAAQPLHRRRR